MGWYDQAKEDHLEHHGVLGQKWGVRRFQNRDGSLTAEGKKRIYNGGSEYGGYETLRSRHRRSIEGAKYSRDIEKNQKKLDKATAKRDQKKIDKYAKADQILKKNKDIMLKDLSDAEIKMGEDYIKTVKAMTIGGLLFGPMGAVAAGTGVRAQNKMAETEREVYAQDRTRKANYEAAIKNAKEDAQRMRSFDQTIDNSGGKIDVAHFPSHDREGRPTYMLTDKQKQQYADEYNEMRKNMKARDEAKEKARKYDQSYDDNWSESKSDKLWDDYYDNASKVRDYDRKHGHLGDNRSDKQLYEMKQIYYPYDNDTWARTRGKLDKKY